MKISIVTVTYNSSKTVRDTFKSVLEQNYPNIEYLVIDGDSQDGTVQIIKEHEDDFSNRNITFKWISERDNGIYDAINKGIRMATGDVVGILNSDDYFAGNDTIEEIANAFLNKRVDCVYGDLNYIDSETRDVTRVWRSRDFKKGLFEKSWTPAHPTFYCKRTLYEKHGLYNIKYKIAADVDLMFRFLEIHQANSLYLRKLMVIMRQGGISSSGLKSTKTIIKEMRDSFITHKGKFNVVKYLFYKALKLRQFKVKMKG